MIIYFCTNRENVFSNESVTHTIIPSQQPSFVPTVNPTLIPTLIPTIIPTAIPTMSPESRTAIRLEDCDD